MWEGKRLLLLFTAFFCFCVICPAAGNAGVQALSDDATACLECHGQQGITFHFRTRESAEAYVNAEKFKASIHASLGCSGCHTDFSKDNHPPADVPVQGTVRNQVRSHLQAMSYGRADKKSPSTPHSSARKGGAGLHHLPQRPFHYRRGRRQDGGK